MDLKLIEALESLRQADDSNRLQAYQQVREQIEPLSKTAGQLRKLQIVHASDSIAIERAIDWLNGAEEQGRDCLAMLDFLASDDVFDELRKWGLAINSDECETSQEAIEERGCWHNQDFTSIVWYGTKFTFNKPQGHCIQFLWENETASKESIGEHISCSAKETYRLMDTFRSKKHGTHEAWRKVIKSHGNGVYSLIKPKRRPTKNTP